MPKKNVIKKLLDLEDDLQAEIEDNEYDTVRKALVNVRSAIAHVQDAVRSEEAQKR
jgi:hypothetical protein